MPRHVPHDPKTGRMKPMKGTGRPMGIGKKPPKGSGKKKGVR